MPSADCRTMTIDVRLRWPGRLWLCLAWASAHILCSRRLTTLCVSRLDRYVQVRPLGARAWR